MKKRHTTRSVSSNRIPPSIPKCVRKCSDGYTTDYIPMPVNKPAVKFIFRKMMKGYTVLKVTSNSPDWVDMGNNITISPATRNLFSNLTTLKEAINAVETWIGFSLPDIR